MRNVLACSLLLLASSAIAKTFYVSPTGADANSGTMASPWRTWQRAFSSTSCGDTLIALNGVYSITASGRLILSKDCSAAAPYEVRAQNERGAVLNGDGRATVVRVSSSAFVKLEGLLVRNVDQTAANGGIAASNVAVFDSHHITISRFLVERNNRFFNAHLIQLTRTRDSLVEENEIYFYHRHGIILNSASDNIVRRNYCSVRGYQNPSIGPAGQYPPGGSCVIVYPGSNNTIENNISDGHDGKGFSVQALGLSRDNRFLGNVSYGGTIGFGIDTRGDSAAYMPVNTVVANMVVVNAESEAFRARGSKNTQISNSTAIDSEYGYLADVARGQEGDGQYSFTCSSCVSVGSRKSGFFVQNTIQNWTISNPRSWGSPIAYSPLQSPNYQNRLAAEVNPSLGACYVWAPSGSALKGAGPGGSDLGAQILYRYENGQLTRLPLWRSSGVFEGCGAEVQGLNDDPADSCRGVHLRLHVNSGGCPFPPGYPGTAQLLKPRSPRDIRVR